MDESWQHCHTALCVGTWSAVRSGDGAGGWNSADNEALHVTHPRRILLGPRRSTRLRHPSTSLETHL